MDHLRWLYNIHKDNVVGYLKWVEQYTHLDKFFLNLVKNTYMSD